MAQRPTPSPPHGDSKRALLEAREVAVRDGTDRQSHSKDDGTYPRKSRLLPLLFFVTVAFGGYVLVTKPAWLITPPPPPEPAPIVDASLRVAMWQQALYVERYRTNEGRLPEDLAQAGAPQMDGIFYHRIGEGSYLISGSNGDIDLVLRSEDSFDDFVGESLEIISNRGAL